MNDVIRREAAGAVVDLLGPGTVVSRFEGPASREWSWQFSLHVPGPQGGDLLLKIPRWEEAPTLEAALAAGEQDSTHAELDGLRRIELAVLAAGDPGLTAVEPLGYVSAVNGILMRRLDAIPLRERLGPGRGRGDTAALFDRIGRWIRVFHGIGGAARRIAFDPAAESDALRDVEAVLRRSGVEPAGLLPALAALRQAAERLEGSTEPLVEVHGDLNASNVLVARDERVAVIDPNRAQGRALDDIARLLTDVRLDRMQLATGGVVRRDSVLDEWERRVTTAAGYATEPIMAYRLARHVVERWAEVETEVTGAGRLGLLPGRTLLRRVVRRRLGALA